MFGSGIHKKIPNIKTTDSKIVTLLEHILNVNNWLNHFKLSQFSQFKKQEEKWELEFW